MALKFTPQQLEIAAYCQVPGKTAEDYFRDKSQPASLAGEQRRRILANDKNAKSYHAKYNSLLAIPEVRAWLLGDASPSKAEFVWKLAPRTKRARKVRRETRTPRAEKRRSRHGRGRSHA